jgi:SAM-dependent methyltransferase
MSKRNVLTGMIYHNAFVYETSMLLLYGRSYFERYRVIADMIPPHSSVLDLCCGPATLYHWYLKQKHIAYTGMDINEKFIQALRKKGIKASVEDLRHVDSLPEHDYVMMQSSLYHFLPDIGPLLQKMTAAARKQVILVEPVQNLITDQPSWLVSLLGKLGNPGTGDQTQRFTELMLDETLASMYDKRLIQHSQSVANGREKLYILNMPEKEYGKELERT